MTDAMERIEPDRAEVSSLRTPELDLKDPPNAGGAVRRNRPALAQGCGTTTAALPESDMAKAVGEPGWWRLKPEIQERFAKDVKAGQVKRYEGVMSEVACSKAGWLLAQLCRLLGTPLATAAGRDVPTTVLVYPDPSGMGTVWDRIYFFPEKAPVTVRSSKVLDERDRLLERVGGGFGMLLRVFEREQALHMVSQRYFLEWRGRRLYLPDLLSPGTAHVIHSDEGSGVFRFRLTIAHPLLGSLFVQDGLFSDDDETPSNPMGRQT